MNSKIQYLFQLKEIKKKTEHQFKILKEHFNSIKSLSTHSSERNIHYKNVPKSVVKSRAHDSNFVTGHSMLSEQEKMEKWRYASLLINQKLEDIFQDK